MALYFTTQINAPSGYKAEHNWHVGENKRRLDDDETVIELQADGDELDEILLRIEGIPVAKHKRVMIWRGDIAQFIWENL